MKVYLAGPDVFHPQAREIGAAKRAICRELGLEGLFPLDNAENTGNRGALEAARAIYRGNVALMEACDAAIANLTPFRGPGCDPGTAFELGYMRALGRPVAAYTADPRTYPERVRDRAAVQAAADGGLVDGDGLAVEDFGLVDNLMLDGAVQASGLTVAAPDAPPAGDPYLDHAAFRRALAALAERLRRGDGAAPTPAG